MHTVHSCRIIYVALYFVKIRVLLRWNLKYSCNLQYNSLTALKCKIEKVPRGIRGEKSSKDMASSRNSVSTIGALASPKIGDGTRCPEG